jgi:molecular chaperone DnaK (HSP70)
VRLGIDFGTTRTLVAAVDRGNYPVLAFDAGGDGCEHVPTVSAEVGGEIVHGWRAEEAALTGAPHLRSFKRLLGRHGPEHVVRIGTRELTLIELVSSFLAALREEIAERSNLPKKKRSGAFEAVVSVPANAHSSQRWATLEAFRRAGFEVRALINEPSAAGIEFAHRHANAITGKREHVAVYDLGGGTFDAALVSLADGGHEVLATAGVQELGGDDFDLALCELALEKLGRGLPLGLGPALLWECRAVKESIHTATKKLVLDLAALGDAAPAEPVVVPVSEYYERLRPLVERSIASLEEAMAAAPTGEAGVAGVYVVGGASALPLVARHLRERFARRVHRAPNPAGSTAMGLAIAAEAANGAAAPLVQERFTRHLGVFREAAAGRDKPFDRIFASGTALPNGAPLVATRSYRAAHNIGQLRFVECASLGTGGQPEGDISPHGTVYFPYAPALRGGPLDAAAIARLDGDGPLIEERYEVDGAGVVTVVIRDTGDGYSQRFVLGQ